MKKGYEVIKAKEVKIVKEVKRSIGLKCFACGNAFILVRTCLGEGSRHRRLEHILHVGLDFFGGN